MGVLALAVVLPLLRQRGAPSWDTIWAEDGYLFYQQAASEGPFAVMLRPYAGYLQLVPRLLAAVATALPLDWLAAYLAVSATLVGALVAWFVYAASAGWVTSRPVRLALASMLVLMPALGQENTATITNVIWVIAAAVPWALVSQAERLRDVVVRALFCVLAALSMAVCVTFAPLAVVYPLLRRTRATIAVATAFLVALAGQAAVVVRQAALAHVLETGTLPLSLGRIIVLTSVRVFAMFLIGDKAIAAVWHQHGRLLIAAATGALVLLIAAVFPHTPRRSQALAAAFAACAILSFVLPVAGRGALSGAVVLDRPYWSYSLRYSVVPVFLLASAAALLVAPPGPARGRGIARIARAVFVTQVVVLCAIDFSVQNVRSVGPRWTDALARARHECADLDADRPIRIRLNAWFANQAVVTPCRAVLSDSK